MMIEKNRQLFERAIVEVINAKFEEEMMQCYETAECSRRHCQKMSMILGFEVNENNRYKQSSRKRLIAILIAVAVLLTGCAVAFHNEIYDFAEEVYEKYIRFAFTDEIQNDAPSAIEEAYELSYVPGGYEFETEEITKIFISQRYANQDGDHIVFQQQPTKGLEIHLDAEEGETTIIKHKNLEVYCREKDTFAIYLWTDGIYSLQLRSNKPLEKYELLNIIDGIVSRTI